MNADFLVHVMATSTLTSDPNNAATAAAAAAASVVVVEDVSSMGSLVKPPVASLSTHLSNQPFMPKDKSGAAAPPSPSPTHHPVNGSRVMAAINNLTAAATRSSSSSAAGAASSSSSSSASPAAKVNIPPQLQSLARSPQHNNNAAAVNNNIPNNAAAAAAAVRVGAAPTSPALHHHHHHHHHHHQNHAARCGTPPPVPPRHKGLPTNSPTATRGSTECIFTNTSSTLAANSAAKSKAKRLLKIRPAPPPNHNPWTDDEALLKRLFSHFQPCERCVLTQVCKKWRNLLYHPQHWTNATMVINCRKWKSETDKNSRLKFFNSLRRRGIDSLCLFGASDADVRVAVDEFPSSPSLAGGDPLRVVPPGGFGGAGEVRGIVLRCANVSDAGLEALLERFKTLTRLELSGCNEITESGLWQCFQSSRGLTSLTIADCINVADDTLGAVAQLLPNLVELNLQAYHVTDVALSFFSAKQSNSLVKLQLRSCWEITNQGIIHLVRALPNLRALNLSGCSKITDDGVEVIAEHLRLLQTLDLSWCPRVTDASLEYLACDLGASLQELVLDRCVHVTDVGIGHIAAMTSIQRLFLRWCTQIHDISIQHLLGMPSLRVLSIAGCGMLTTEGLSQLVQLIQLEELELTNCPGATHALLMFLGDHMPNTLIIG